VEGTFGEEGGASGDTIVVKEEGLFDGPWDPHRDLREGDVAEDGPRDLAIFSCSGFEKLLV